MVLLTGTLDVHFEGGRALAIMRAPQPSSLPAHVHVKAEAAAGLPTNVWELVAGARTDNSSLQLPWNAWTTYRVYDAAGELVCAVQCVLDSRVLLQSEPNPLLSALR